MSFEAIRRGHEGRPGWKIRFDYDEEQIDALKRFVPSTARAWNEEHKYWWVAIGWEDALVAIFPQFEAYLHQIEMPL